MSSKIYSGCLQNRLGWQGGFVSGFMYETDATFNTNYLKMPLSVIVGIDNTSKTFLIAFCYITSESAVSFK